MKKLLLVFSILLFAVGGVIIFFTRETRDAAINAVTTSVTRESPTVERQISPSLPRKLRIPKLTITTDIEYVGMDKNGNMDVPQKDENVAWFQPGYVPGNKGNAVLAGHYDKKNGDPAVFYELQSLKAGDEIEVIMENEQIVTFVVKNQETYATEDFPLETVFGPASRPQLNLITCEGDFDQQKRSYSHRTVVYTELSSSTPN